MNKNKDRKKWIKRINNWINKGRLHKQERSNKQKKELPRSKRKKEKKYRKKHKKQEPIKQTGR